MKPMRFQNLYQGNFDFYKSWKKLSMTFPSVDRMHGGTIRFRIGTNVFVLMTPTRKIQVAWSNEEEKIRCLKVLKQELVPLDEESEITLKPVSQTVTNIPYPAPQDFKLIWCEEAVQYLSFDKYSRIKNEYDEIMKDYLARLDFESLQRRAQTLYPILPKIWQKKLDPLFKDKHFMKMKHKWAEVFVGELNRLMWETSRNHA